MEVYGIKQSARQIIRQVRTPCGKFLATPLKWLNRCVLKCFGRPVEMSCLRWHRRCSVTTERDSDVRGSSSGAADQRPPCSSASLVISQQRQHQRQHQQLRTRNTTTRSAH